MGSFNLAFQLRCSALDVGMEDAPVFDMPMERCLELMAIIGSDFADAEWELFDDAIDKVGHVGLCMLVIDLELALNIAFFLGHWFHPSAYLSPT
jgi:hypothetical protein